MTGKNHPSKGDMSSDVAAAANTAQAKGVAADAIGSVAESTMKAEAASEAKLEAQQEGFHKVYEELAKRAETPEERERVREDVKAEANANREHDLKKTAARYRFASFAVTAVAVVVGASAGLIALVKKK